MCKRLFFVIIIVLYGGFCQLACAESLANKNDDWAIYEWGRGVSFPAANLNVGGYFKGSYNVPEKNPAFGRLDDLSVFMTWTPLARLRFFAEIEQHSWLNSLEGTERFIDALNVERLFAELLINDSWSVRFGKYLTPFGRWNLIHFAPLVWTTNRPVVTNDFSFAPRANGLMVNYTQIVHEHNLDVSLYVDNSTNLEPKSFNNVNFDRAIGLRLNYEVTEELQVGTSYLAYRTLADISMPTHHLWGLDFLWQHQGYELMFESLYHVWNDPELYREEKGLYLQGVAPLIGKLSAVARYEFINTNKFKPFYPNDTVHTATVGLAWRPYVPLVFKSEYRLGDNNELVAGSGFFLSLSMFF